MMIIGLFAVSIAHAEPTAQVNLDQIRLPEGFSIAIYSDNVRGARSLAVGDNGTVFVGTRNSGVVYALVDFDGDNIAESLYTIATNLNSPNGVAFHEGSLYVAEIHRIIRYDNIEAQLDNPPRPIVVYEGFPRDTHHGWKYLRIGADNMLYAPVGVPCDICDVDVPYGAIHRLNLDGTGIEVVAQGVRNTVGFDFNPETGELWFTDNGNDAMGDEIPPDELNRVSVIGEHFGFPFCLGGFYNEDAFGLRDCSEFTAPMQLLQAHTAALGMRFYVGDMFPEAYQEYVFIAEHGSRSHSEKVGYRVTMVRVVDNFAVSYEIFADGWLQGDEEWGRPVDILVMPDGAMLVSDDFAGVIYRISYQAP
jgi:glucose/arabinose dehydrogenase